LGLEEVETARTTEATPPDDQVATAITVPWKFGKLRMCSVRIPSISQQPISFLTSSHQKSGYAGFQEARNTT
jgi:hypothetical protein